MAELERYNGIEGRIPWTMTQDQRGPTCGCTSIAVAYRILTGWTVFPTKGNYRQFSKDRRGIELQKGNENLLSIRQVAKFDDVTVAGEIVNADDMVSVINKHAEGVRAQVVELDQHPIGRHFVEQVRAAFKAGLAPLVLFYIDGPTDKIGRKYDFQHWVNIYAIEHNGEWLYTPIKNLTTNLPLSLKTKPKAEQILIWTWGKAYVVDGEALGEASALSINWAEPPRMWQKQPWREGALSWDEISPKDKKYVKPKPQSVPSKNVRYTLVKPKRDLREHGFVVMGLQ